jgi:DNA (cytosine-5)-methyltransferase 1
VLGALEDLGYSAWPFVVGAVHVGANHEWLRAWIIAFDTAQIGHDGGRSWGYGPDGDGEAYPRGRVAHTAKIGLRARPGNDESSDRGHDRLFAANSLGDGFRSFADADGDTVRVSKLSERPFAEAAFVEHADSDPSQDGWRAGRQGRCFEPVAGIPVEARGDDGDADGEPRAAGISPSSHEECGNVGTRCLGSRAEPGGNVDGSHADKDGEHDGAVDDEMGERAGVGGNVGEPWPEWNGGFANHLRMDDGLSAWVADTRVEVGTGRGTSAASLIVEAFGDAVIPEITYRIGRSIRRVETALAAIHGAAA